MLNHSDIAPASRGFMPVTMRMMRLVSPVAAVMLASVALLPAQEAGRPVESRLDAMESLYQQRMTENRTPHLKQYIQDLRKLHDNYLRAAQSREAKAVEEEIERATLALNQGTDLPGNAAEKNAGNQQSLAEIIDRGRKPRSDATVFVLRSPTSEFQRTSWEHLVGSPDLVGNETRAIGERGWRIDWFPKGNYHVIAAVRPDPDIVNMRLQMKVGDDTSARIRIRSVPDDVGRDSVMYLHLGTATVDSDLTDAWLTINATSSWRQEARETQIDLWSVLLIAY